MHCVVGMRFTYCVYAFYVVWSSYEFSEPELSHALDYWVKYDEESTSCKIYHEDSEFEFCGPNNCVNLDLYCLEPSLKKSTFVSTCLVVISKSPS